MKLLKSLLIALSFFVVLGLLIGIILWLVVANHFIVLCLFIGLLVGAMLSYMTWDIYTNW
jgi:hypothetical protein